jgi:hypothetical protein
MHTAGVGESQIDDLIADLEVMSNPTVGLAAHSGQVDIRITAKADSEKSAIELINPIETILLERLGDWIYGVDQDTLEEIALRSIAKHQWKIAVIEAGLRGFLIRRLAAVRDSFVGGQLLADTLDAETLMSRTDTYRQSLGVEVGFGVALHTEPDKQFILMALITPLGKQDFVLPYGGTPDYASLWAFNHSLNIIRRI